MIFYSLCSTCTCPWCRPTSRKHKSSMSAFKASTGRNKQQSKRLRLKIGYHKKSAGESSSFRQCSHMFSLRLPVVGYIPHSLTQPYRPRPKFFANIATFFICFFFWYWHVTACFIHVILCSTKSIAVLEGALHRSQPEVFKLLAIFSAYLLDESRQRPFSPWADLFVIFL